MPGIGWQMAKKSPDVRGLVSMVMKLLRWIYAAKTAFPAVSLSIAFNAARAKNPERVS